MKMVMAFAFVLSVPAVLGLINAALVGVEPTAPTQGILVPDLPLLPQSPLPDDVAIDAIRLAADRAASRKDLNGDDLATISKSTRVMVSGWDGRPPRQPVADWALTRILHTLEWAIQNGDATTLKSLAGDMAAKADDCRASPNGRFGEVLVTIRTVLPDGREQKGLQVRYIERFYFDLLKKVPTLASRWQEFATVSAIDGAPLTAGEWMIVARSADGREISEAKLISVGGKRPAKFDLSLK